MVTAMTGDMATVKAKVMFMNIVKFKVNVLSKTMIKIIVKDTIIIV